MLTKEEYKMLEIMVMESMQRIAESRIMGFDEFNMAISKEIDKRRELAHKLHYLCYGNN